MSVKLDGAQYKQLSKLIRLLFKPKELTWLLRFAFNKSIYDITLADDYQGIVFDVIGDSQRKGWTLELINALREARPDDPLLFGFSQQFDLVTENTPDRSALEKIIIKTDTFLDVMEWRTHLGQIERQVCAIRLNGQPAGTGFLLGPNVIMTNYHVVEDVIKKKLGSEAVTAVFDYKKLANGNELNTGKSYGLAEDWLIDSSPYSEIDLVPISQKMTAPQPDELDYAILRLKGSPGSQKLSDPEDPDSPTRGWLKPHLPKHNFREKPALFIMQHPSGMPLKLALNTKSVLDVNSNQTRVIYQTNTEPGSSGSPCFDQDWNLVALHHSGDPTKMPTWNEGIPFTAIMALLEQRGKVDELGRQNSAADAVVDNQSDDDVMADLYAN